MLRQIEEVQYTTCISVVNKLLKSSLMSMLVLIRNIEEMDTALEAANKYVIFMQKLFDSISTGELDSRCVGAVWIRNRSTLLELLKSEVYGNSNRRKLRIECNNFEKTGVYPNCYYWVCGWPRARNHPGWIKLICIAANLLNAHVFAELTVKLKASSVIGELLVGAVLGDPVQQSPCQPFRPKDFSPLVKMQITG